jgi:hypothetical protein
MKAVDQPCPNCGLCCNGVLFADVELQPGDDAGRLAALGMALKKKGGKRAFVQPCHCFDGQLCNIYANRPRQCRAFECGLLKRVQAGAMSPETALKKIAAAKKRVAKVERLLLALGESDEKRALIQRYTRAMSAPTDLSAGKDAASLSGKLLLAYDELMRALQRDFLE